MIKIELFLLPLIFCFASYGMDKSNISQMDSVQLEVFIRSKGGYRGLSPNELSLVNLQKTQLKSQRFEAMKKWTIHDATNFLCNCKSPAGISDGEWGVICRIMGSEKNNIIKAFFHQRSSLMQKNPSIQGDAKPEASRQSEQPRLEIHGPQKAAQHIPTVEEINTWTPVQVGDFIGRVEDLRAIDKEVWDALERAADKSDHEMEAIKKENLLREIDKIPKKNDDLPRQKF